MGEVKVTSSLHCRETENDIGSSIVVQYSSTVYLELRKVSEEPHREQEMVRSRSLYSGV